MLKERAIRVPAGGLTELVGTGNKIYFLSKREDLDLLPSDVVSVHLSHQRLVNIEFLRGLVARFSSIRTVQVAPHNFKRVAGPGIRAIAAEVDIKIVEARFADRACYNKRAVSKSYQAKRLFFEQALTDPGKRILFELMRAHDFPEIGVVEAYFGPEPASLLQIAQGLDRPYQWVQKKVGAFLHWLGMDSKSKAVLGAVHNLERRLERTLQEDGFETEKGLQTDTERIKSG